MEKAAVPKRIQRDVRDIFIYRNSSVDDYVTLPFYADGYPGLIYIESSDATASLPQEKKLSPFFMYGQTVNPITLRLRTPYLLLIFRIEPMSGYEILNSDSSELINDCLDLTKSFETNTTSHIEDLQKEGIDQKIETIANFLTGIMRKQDVGHYPEIQKAIRMIIEKDGDVSIREIRDSLFISERTLQRQFQKIVGVTPKKLALIVRYHTSKKKSSVKDSASFFDAADVDSYTDQSHFIRQFKRFSGKTPVGYLQYIDSINHQPPD